MHDIYQLNNSMCIITCLAYKKTKQKLLTQLITCHLVSAYISHKKELYFIISFYVFYVKKNKYYIDVKLMTDILKTTIS